MFVRNYENKILFFAFLQLLSGRICIYGAGVGYHMDRTLAIK